MCGNVLTRRVVLWKITQQKKVIECCADYVKDGKWIGLPIPLHEGRLRGKEEWVRKLLSTEITV
jgi:hypothetical protein